MNFRLIRLYQHGYLTRHYLPTVKGSSQAIYTLDRAGLPAAAERLGKDVNDFWRPKTMIHPVFLNHQIAVIDVRIAFELTARTHEDHQLTSWLAENTCYDRFLFGANWRALTPDAFLRYRVGKQVLSAFIEVDQGTMPNRRFQEKVERYFAYDVSGRYTERYKGQRFRVLAIVTARKRLLNLKQTAAQVAQRYCWFTTPGEIRANGPLAPIWLVVGQEGNQSLLREPVGGGAS